MPFILPNGYLECWGCAVLGCDSLSTGSAENRKHCSGKAGYGRLSLDKLDEEEEDLGGEEFIGCWRTHLSPVLHPPSM